MLRRLDEIFGFRDNWLVWLIILALPIWFAYSWFSDDDIENTLASKQTIQKQEERQDSLIEARIFQIEKSLTTKYDISYKWDTLYYDFSIDYTPVINTEYQIIGDGSWTIKDVFQSDSGYFASIACYARTNDQFLLKKVKTFEFLLSLNDSLIQELRIDKYPTSTGPTDILYLGDDPNVFHSQLVVSISHIRKANDVFQGGGQLIDLARIDTVGVANRAIL